MPYLVDGRGANFCDTSGAVPVFPTISASTSSRPSIREMQCARRLFRPGATAGVCGTCRPRSWCVLSLPWRCSGRLRCARCCAVCLTGFAGHLRINRHGCPASRKCHGLRPGLARNHSLPSPPPAWRRWRRLKRRLPFTGPCCASLPLTAASSTFPTRRGTGLCSALRGDAAFPQARLTMLEELATQAGFAWHAGPCAKSDNT